MGDEELERFPKVNPHDNEIQLADHELGRTVLELKTKYNLTVLEIIQLLNSESRRLDFIFG